MKTKVYFILKIDHHIYFGGMRNSKVRFVQYKEQSYKFGKLKRAESMAVSIRETHPMSNVEVVTCNE